MKCLMKAWGETEHQLYGWLIKQTQSQQETEDIMQEVFLKAMKNSERFCTLEDGKSWLFRVTKNLIIDRLRKKMECEDIEEFVAPSEIPPVMTQLQTCLPRLLPKLTDSERDIIEQCDLFGATQLDYATRNGLTLSATKARLRRARNELKHKLIVECKVEQDDSGVCCFKRIEG
ncbi:ECF RNA polymerase sigma factor SigW [Vibrio comitans NBRC 102076]|uniref:ECF RNA polymerase sigma factor SigW n=2 Tax=Vibrio comitans TaxID=413401 RepID=A0A4Y3ILB6_9VIBR|nr:sigma-70 family RNA polymerase sigma factor [Vibrio comitans]GEA60186.1 ECF RNA polymerase sigma factor SigW [Vibrio comitans NBRC 102076]